jgi:hypothetical protein
MLWFVDGSGGESHLRRSSRDWLPTGPLSQGGRGQDSEVTNLLLDVGVPLLPSRLLHET